MSSPSSTYWNRCCIVHSFFLYLVQLWLPSVSTTFRKWSAHAWCCRLNHVNFLLQLLCCQLVFPCQLQSFSQLSTLFLPLQSQQDDQFILRQQFLNAFQKYFEVIMAEQTIFTFFCGYFSQSVFLPTRNTHPGFSLPFAFATNWDKMLHLTSNQKSNHQHNRLIKMRVLNLDSFYVCASRVQVLICVTEQLMLFFMFSCTVLFTLLKL